MQKNYGEFFTDFVLVPYCKVYLHTDKIPDK